MKNTNLQNRLKNIFDKYNKKSGGDWLAENFIPPEEKEKYRIMFIGQKPSEHFKKRPQIKALGNYNATSIDKAFHCYLQKYNLGKVYATDMVKTEGRAGADFELEWNADSNNDGNFKECLKQEIKCYKPKLIVFISEKAEKLFKNNFSDLEIATFRIYQPSYVYRRNKFEKWDKQFEELKTIIKKQNYAKK